MITSLKKFFLVSQLILALSFSVLPLLPQPTFAQNVSPEDQKRCDTFRVQFGIGPLVKDDKGNPVHTTNIIGDNPVFCSASQVIT